ncbi:MAG: hypothetical protein ABWK05_01510 [Pyrobaculum sp.]
MKALLVTLLAIFAVAEATLVVTYSIKLTGEVSATALVREALVNNNSTAANISGVLLPPYSAIVVETPAQNLYPPFLSVSVKIEYVNGTFTNGVLYGDNATLIKIRLVLQSTLHISLPVVISVATDNKVALLYKEPPAVVTQLSGFTVYYWTVVVTNSTEFILTIKVREFGSFGAVRLPTISISSTLRLRQSLDATNARLQELRRLADQAQNFTKAVSLYADVVYGQLQNLTELIRILNLTGLALEQGSRALNTSAYALEAFRRQLYALGDAALGVAATLNQSLLLVDYQYVALITAANLLETQAQALQAYADAATRGSESLSESRQRLLNIRSDLLVVRSNLDNTIRSLEEVKKMLESLATQAPNASQILYTAAASIDAVISQLKAARNSVDALIDVIDNTVAVVDSLNNALQDSNKRLSDLSSVLNSTAASTRRNATELRSTMPKVLLNASKNLTAVAENLYKTADEVSGFEAPLANATKTLVGVAKRLREYASQLDEYRRQQLGALPRLGFVQSAIQNYTDYINRQVKTLEYQRSALSNYYSAVNYSEVEMRYYIELPVVVRNITLRINLSPQQPAAKTPGVNPLILATPLVVPIGIALRKLRGKPKP